MNGLIDAYISRIESTKQSILNLQSSDGTNIDTFKISLFYSLINYIATASVPKPATKPAMGYERYKFFTFITDFCDFKEANRVSIPQLFKHLETQTSSNNKNLQEYVNEIIQSWTTRQYNSSSKFMPTPIMLSEDIEVSELISNFGDEKEELTYYTHVHLLYDQRNSLIHSLKKKGNSLNLFHLDVPHYEFQTFGYGNPIKYEKTFELHYPLSFYVDLINNALINLPAYFEDNGIDPVLKSESVYEWKRK